MTALGGRTIAITEARRAAELARLIERLGGTPYVAPALREVPCRDRGPAREVLGRIIRGEVAVVLFMTGVGVGAFLDLAAEAGLREPLLRALARTVVGARGPKTVTALRRAGVRVDVIPTESTSVGLLAALEGHELAGRVVAVQLTGQESPGLTGGLAARGAQVLEIPLYEWAPPDTDTALVALVRDLIDGRIDALAFTASPQITNLLAVADRYGLRASLLKVLDERVPVAVVGPVCEAAARRQGIAPRISAESETLGGLVHAIATFFERGVSYGPRAGS